MRQECKRRPGGGGAAVRLNADEWLQPSNCARICHPLADTSGLVRFENPAACWVAERFGVHPARRRPSPTLPVSADEGHDAARNGPSLYPPRLVAGADPLRDEGARAP